MSRNIRVSEPSAEMQIKIIRAKDAIASQKPRLGYLNRKKDYEYRDPLEVWP